MGLVAWASEDTLAEPVSNASAEPDVPSVSIVAEPVALPDIATDRSDLASLAQWLVEQPLIPFVYRGTTVCHVGPDQAQILVVSLHHGTPQTAPLDAQSSQLFDLMMRAVEQPRNAIRQCAVSSAQRSVPDNSLVPTYLEQICTPHTRALLILDSSIVDSASPADADQGRLPTSSLPVWRLPHPEVLLRTPAIKRRAWQTLKAMRRSLVSL